MMLAKHKTSHHSRSLSLIIVAVGMISTASLSLPGVIAQPAAGKVSLTHETMWL